MISTCIQAVYCIVFDFNDIVSNGCKVMQELKNAFCPMQIFARLVDF